jgi:hypothetical protein
MKKVISIALKVMGVMLILLTIVLIWGLQRVDYSPYFESDYYTRTRERLDSLADGLSLQKGKLLVGFGKVSITPTLVDEEENAREGLFGSVPLAGYGDREGAGTLGIHDSLFVKAVAFQVEEKVMVLIGSDMLIVPPQVSEGASKLIQAKRGVTRQRYCYKDA